MERIANPVSGRLDDGFGTAAPPSRRMLLCRFAFALVIPVHVLVSTSLAPALDAERWWIPLVPFLVVILLLGVGAHGSWWRPAPWSAWQAGVLVETGVLVVGAMVAVVVGPGAIAVTAILLIGAVLGVGAAQVWRALPDSRA